MDRYEPQTIEPKWQRIWEEARAFNVPNPEPGAPADDAHFYQLEMLPYPSANGIHMGHVLNYTMGDVVTHVRRRSGWTVAAADGLGRVRAARRERRHPRGRPSARDHRAQHQDDPRADEASRLGDRLGPRGLVARPAFYSWTQWLFLRFYEKGLAYRREAPVNWCPNDQTVLANEEIVDGQCERCGAQVELRNMTQWFFKITAYADAAARRSRRRRLAGALEGDAAQLDRPLGGSGDPLPVEELDIDIPVFTTRPDTLFGATFFVVAPEHPLVEVARERPRRGEYVEARGREAHRGARGRDATRRASSAAATRQPGQRRAAADLGRRLRADGLRHGRDHGRARARRARPRVRRDAFGLPDRRAVIDDDAYTAREARQLRQFDGLPHRGGEARDRRVAARGRARRAGGHLPPARLELLAPALLGLPDPDRLLRRLRHRPGAGRPAAGRAPRGRDYRPKGEAPLAANEEWMNVACPKCGGPARARGRHDGHVRRLLLVLPALRRPAQRQRAVRPRRRRLLDAGDQYIGGIEHANVPPAVLALLRQGAERLRHARVPRAVRRAVPPGLGADGRDEDVEDEGQRRRPRRDGRGVRRRCGAAVHPVHGARRPGHGVAETGIEGIVRFLRRLWRLVHEVAENAPAPARETRPSRARRTGRSRR